MIAPVSRRGLLAGTSAVALAGMAQAVPAFAFSGGLRRRPARPAPLGAVTLKPSIFAKAQDANRAYLASLDPERLLHNFYLSAGLEAPKPVYGGWEARGIAGHSLGHWLSGASLLISNTGDVELAASLDHCLKEMARIQVAQGDGYCGGTTVERDGETVDGKIVFEELRRGDIRSSGFDLNGGWVPLYTWHKIHAGLIDAHRLAGNRRAMSILLGVAGYMGGVLDALNNEQMQRVLAAEHGGLNESYADTYVLTGNRRWLKLAERIHHRAVLDPLVAGQDRLEGLHANTQIPKVIGLARLWELSGDESKGNAARFFHQTVRDHHSYVIGGNSEREHFGSPDHRAKRITEATCEACNSYNMLKLTRHLYSWEPDAGLFDYYERVQLNHIMAHQRPDDGRFVYFMPLAAGARRIYSSPEDSFWCCVGSGMESHAKHADSIFWTDSKSLFVNLYIPSKLEWTDEGWEVDLDTKMPLEGSARLTFMAATSGARRVALRIPGWTFDPILRLNGKVVQPVIEHGYAIVSRWWCQGDVIELELPMALRREAVPDDPSLVAFSHGPLVLAADLGSADEDYAGIGPAIVTGGDPCSSLTPLTGELAQYMGTGALGEQLALKPFFAQYDRRAAVYFPTFSPSQWEAEKAGYIRAQEAGRELVRRTWDTIYFGEMQPERDHALTPGNSEVVNWNGRSARRVLPGGRMSLDLARPDGPAVLQFIVWGSDAARRFWISVDGTEVSVSWPDVAPVDDYVALDFPFSVTTSPTSGQPARIEIEAQADQVVVYELRMLTAVD